ncbi:hypothetical protein NSS91_15960 [Caldifermentibacillus hisashii]|uniref:hypothetical protein n=1 Tax=Caldifermentibacillus hisashii TaxID=996558 RepID=UPI0031FD07D0
MARRKVDLKGKRFGRLTVLEELPERKNGKVVWRCRCDCGNVVNVVSTYLTSGQTTSCGCVKKELEAKHLREGYENKRVNNVVLPLFKGKEPRKDSTTGFRGVRSYYAKKSKEVRYRAWITVNGKRYYKGGFRTPEDAYYNGRLKLEEKYLPKKENDSHEKR